MRISGTTCTAYNHRLQAYGLGATPDRNENPLFYLDLDLTLTKRAQDVTN